MRAGAWEQSGGDEAPPAGLNGAGRGAQVNETLGRWRRSLPEAPLSTQCTAPALDTPKPRSAAGGGQAQLPDPGWGPANLPGSAACSLAPGRPGTRGLTAAAASCAGSPWQPPPAACATLGSDTPAGNQEDWRARAAALPARGEAAEVHGLMPGAGTTEGRGRPGAQPATGRGPAMPSPGRSSPQAPGPRGRMGN